MFPSFNPLILVRVSINLETGQKKVEEYVTVL